MKASHRAHLNCTWCSCSSCSRAASDEALSTHAMSSPSLRDRDALITAALPLPSFSGGDLRGLVSRVAGFLSAIAAVGAPVAVHSCCRRCAAVLTASAADHVQIVRARSCIFLLSKLIFDDNCTLLRENEAASAAVCVHVRWAASMAATLRCPPAISSRAATHRQCPISGHR